LSITNDCSACRSCSGNADPKGFTLSWGKSNNCKRLGASIGNCSTSVSCAINCAGPVASGSFKDCASNDSCSVKYLGNSYCTFSATASCKVTCIDGVFNFTESSCSGSGC
jgi:hypothetical protein